MSRKLEWRVWPVIILLLALVACQSPAPSTRAPWDWSNAAPVQVQEVELAQPENCEGRFVVHDLPVATGMRMREINTYESNGAGVAVNDLDGDGDLDLVFASVDRESTILWNQGALTFTEETLDDQFTRGVTTVDVDGDGPLDIVFSHRGLASPSYWRNQDGGFVQQPLPDVADYPYTMAWADLNGDNALDLVTASYNIDLKQQGIADPDHDEQAGVFYYERHGDGFMRQRLAAEAEALAIGLVDIDGDGFLDIWVANDFNLEDYVWLAARPAQGDMGNAAWTPAEPFAQTSHSTMSIDWGDIDNDGEMAFFTTDMNPYDNSTANLAVWLPVTSKLEQPDGIDNPQRMANVLQIRQADAAWRNEAGPRGIEATGWSWAARFGDLDNDGFLDLYVVNGMIAENLFAYLPNGELVEEDRAFRNLGNGTFALAPEWNLRSTDSGRSMVMADLDSDGDLDIVVNNLRSAAELFENRLCSGASLQVDLHWPAVHNTHAIGAQLELETSHGVYRRDVRTASGYLTGDPARIHFGFPEDATLMELRIRWPDGAVTRLANPAPHTLLEITR